MEKIYINAKYRDIVIVPRLAVRPNYDFWMLPDIEKKGKILYTKDGIAAEVVRCDTYTIFDLEKDIKELYNVSAWEYLCRWNKACEDQLTSLYLWRIQLTKNWHGI